MFNLLDPIDRTGDSPAFTRPEVAALFTVASRAAALMADAVDPQARQDLIPRLAAESSEGWARRLAAPSSGVFPSTVAATSSRIAAAVSLSVPDALGRLLTDADGEGTALPAFIAQTVAHVLLQGGTWLIGSTRLPGPFGSRAEALAAGQGAILTVLPRVAAINWRMDDAGLSLLVLEEQQEVQTGTFSTGTERVFRVLERGSYTLYRMKGSRPEVIESGPSPQVIPAIYLGWDSPSPSLSGAGPLVSAAELAVEAMKVRGNLQRLAEACSLPTAVRTGAVATAADGSPSPVILGPDVLLDLAEGSTFSWTEPAGTSLAFLSSMLESLEAKVREAGSAITAPVANESATASALRAQVASAGLGSFLARLCSAVQSALQMAASLEGLPLEVEPEVATFDLEALAPSADPAAGKLTLTLLDAGLLSRADALRALLASGALPLGDASPEALLEAADAERTPAPVDPNANPADAAEAPRVDLSKAFGASR
jgi:hypothetical protein